MFHISILTEKSISCVAPEGRLDTLNSAAFNEEMKVLLDREEYLIIDFSRCNYLASTGIRSLIIAAKKLGAKGGGLMLAALPAEVYQVLEMSGLHNVFHLFTDTGRARDEILRLKNNASQCSELQIDSYRFQIQQLENKSQSAFIWQNQEIVGYNELVMAVGIGSPAESLLGDEEDRGLFINLGNCSGFIPFNKELSPEFRVLKDPSGGGIFLLWALSFGRHPSIRVKLVSPSGIRMNQLLDAISQIPHHTENDRPKALLIADTDGSGASISFGYVTDQVNEGNKHPELPVQLSAYTLTTGKGIRISGARMLLNELPDLKPDESSLDFVNRSLTIENIEEVESLDLSAQLTDPIVWIFNAENWSDAASKRIQVETFESFVFEPYKSFLTRRLYGDSSRVIVKPLHGGYSAQTFQVESFDPDGRKLRPTVLKIANRDIISREADRCERFALPYILNNSAIVLGTSFFCDTGALRYNFVGIGGEQTQLKWLTHYFNAWPARELEPLFDKIFMQILKPWYGQPVREKIYPYRDQDPTFTFFPRLCEAGEELLAVPADSKYFSTGKADEKRINPYWFLRHEYEARRNRAIDYYTSICHGDLNMQNILLDLEMNVYLIDFSETRPRSAVSDFARLEAIFMIEHAPVDSEEDLNEMFAFASRFYSNTRLDQLPERSWPGKSPDIMERNLALTLKMRRYALATVSGDKNIVPYYIAMLEWVLPIVCYSSATLPHKMLSAYIAGLLCEQIMECDRE